MSGREGIGSADHKRYTDGGQTVGAQDKPDSPRIQAEPDPRFNLFSKLKPVPEQNSISARNTSQLASGNLDAQAPPRGGSEKNKDSKGCCQKCQLI